MAVWWSNEGEEPSHLSRTFFASSPFYQKSSVRVFCGRERADFAKTFLQRLEVLISSYQGSMFRSGLRANPGSHEWL